MPLTDAERRTLHDMEIRLETESPDLARALSCRLPARTTGRPSTGATAASRHAGWALGVAAVIIVAFATVGQLAGLGGGLIFAMIVTVVLIWVSSLSRRKQSAAARVATSARLPRAKEGW